MIRQAITQQTLGGPRRRHISVAKMCFEHRREPLGMVLRARISWIVPADRHPWWQQAHEIRAYDATGADLGATGRRTQTRRAADGVIVQLAGEAAALGVLDRGQCRERSVHPVVELLDMLVQHVDRAASPQLHEDQRLSRRCWHALSIVRP